MKQCGFIAIIGRPNVGKSTLLNSILKTKLSITASKVQTTRDNIIGIDTQKTCQYIYMDTPGIHLGKTKTFNQILNRTALSVVKDVDCVLLLIQANKITNEDKKIIDHMTEHKINIPVLLVLTKIDLIKDKNVLLLQISKLDKLFNFSQIIPLSAKKNISIDLLKNQIQPFLPKIDFIYNNDELTDKSTNFLCAEIVREQLTKQLDQELPYQLVVEIEKIIEENNMVKISAVILVEKTHHKAIIIGKNGSKLKQIATNSRQSLEKFFDKKVFLKTWVKLKTNIFEETFKNR
ncbi:MAG: GTPase Era [Gammaproteobacteria bacterium]|nr:MAG: GTPase Era [Gammaproteobacteria bacterium]